MKNKTKLFGVYLPVFAVVAVAVVVMRTVACLTDFNYLTDYFTNKELITAANITVVCGALFLFTYIFTARRDMKLIPSFTSPATFVPTGLVCAALTFMMIFMFENASALLSVGYVDTTGGKNMQTVIYVATAVFALLSMAHFILTALLEKVSSSARANFGLCTVAFLAMYAIYLYFDSTLPINAPNKLLDEMVYLFAALFFLFETRLSLGREKWREYIAFGFISAMLAAYSSIPTLITYFASGYCISNNIYEPIFSLALFIFITARILLTGELIEDSESPIVLSLSDFARERDAIVTVNTEEALAKEEALREAAILAAQAEPEPEDENQISIEEMFEAADEETEAVTADEEAEEIPDGEVEEISDNKVEEVSDGVAEEISGEAVEETEEVSCESEENEETEKQDSTDEENTGN